LRFITFLVGRCELALKEKRVILAETYPHITITPEGVSTLSGTQFDALM